MTKLYKKDGGAEGGMNTLFPEHSPDENNKDQASASPAMRAERLKYLRNLCNLSRRAFCENSDINAYTLKGWELASHGGLTADGAEKVVKRAAKEGVCCSTEWLLNGRHNPPYPSAQLTDLLSVSEPVIADYNLIEKEFSIYQNTFKDAVLEEVVDDGVAPPYHVGDFIAGIKCYDTHILTTLNKICIVQTTDGKKFIRLVKKGSIKDRFTLICTNYYSEIPDIILVNVSLVYSAPITRHYTHTLHSKPSPPSKIL